MKLRVIAVALLTVALLGAGAWAAPDKSPLGKPPGFDKGDRVKYGVWKGKKAGWWHVAWTTAGKPHIFHGTVTIEGGKFDNVKGYELEEAGDWVVVGPKRHKLKFKATTKGGIDGFRFKTDGAKVTFDLHIDGLEIENRIFVGEQNHKPKKIPFTIPND